MKKTLLHILLFLLFRSVYSQDIHFSDFYSSPLNLNPALTGLYRGDLRINGLYRDQYRTVAIPYQTIVFGLDKAKKNIFNSPNSLGFGLQVNADVAGDAHFSTYQFLIPLVLHHSTYADKLTYSGGIGLSLIHNSIDYSALTFPSQFDGDKYNEFIPASETMDKSSITYMSLSAGVNMILKPGEKQTYAIGFALNNLNSPKYSFYSDKEVELKRRYTIHAISRTKVLDNLDVIPSIKIQFQGTQQEYQFGGILYQYLNSVQITAINYGLWFRSKDKDAIVLNLGFNIAGIQTSFSYDINVSSLSEASDGHGAFEIALIYIYNKHKNSKKFKSIKCPSYL